MKSGSLYVLIDVYIFTHLKQLSASPSTHNYLVAPFWSNIDVTVAGSVYFATFRGPHSTALERLDSVNSFIRENQNDGGEFSARWMMVAVWDGVAEYGGIETVLIPYDGEHTQQLVNCVELLLV